MLTLSLRSHRSAARARARLKLAYGTRKLKNFELKENRRKQAAGLQAAIKHISQNLARWILGFSIVASSVDSSVGSQEITRSLQEN